MIRSRSSLFKLLVGLLVAYVGITVYFLGRAGIYDGVVEPEPNWHATVDVSRPKALEKVNISATNYASLFDKVSYTAYAREALPNKCHLYFRNLFEDDRVWKNDPHRGMSLNRDIFQTFEEYKKKVLAKLEKEGDEIPENFDSFVKEQYEEAQTTARNDEQLLHDYVSNLRVFDRCYTNEAAPKNIKKIVQRSFPFLTQDFPEATDCSGNKVKLFGKKAGKNFIFSLKKSLHGKGIVLTVSDKHVTSTVKLIKLLRYMDNRLPIEVIYFENLSQDSISIIANACTAESIYPKQELYFINVNNAVRHDHLGKFARFGNKILATMFNSFQEMIFLDADTVVLKQPEEFFQIAKYKENGTFFFKDRKTVEHRPASDVMFFKKLLPSTLDTTLFDIPQATEYTLDRDFFQGLNHYMESGLVVINRDRHFFQPFMMSFLNFYLPVQARVYGDKELFWLSLALLGDEAYSFNDHFAAAIGQLTPESERSKDVGREMKFKSKELCSNHPAHIDDRDNRTLLWFNTGFQECGQEFDAEEEFGHKRRYTSLKTVEAFKAFFESRLTITHAVIPPHKEIAVSHTKGESNRAWINMRQYCHSYTWCAYSSIGDQPTKDQTGIIIEYSPSEIAHFNTLGDVWMSG